MPSLIGSAPNQVPTNGMLGTMAFQDADNTLVQNITSTGASTLKDISVSGTATFAGVTTAVTQAAGDNSTKLATTAYVFAATPDSSETVKGLIEIATNAEAQAGSDALRAITPANLFQAFKGSNQSLSASGYQKLPGGFIIQWGYIASRATATSTHTFPITFPNACLSLVPTEVFDGVHNDFIKLAANPSPSSFSLRSDSLTYPIYWIAVGY